MYLVAKVVLANITIHLLYALGTGDVKTDMQNQVLANSIRIQVLEQQNLSLSNSITKLRSCSDNKVASPVVKLPAASVSNSEACKQNWSYGTNDSQECHASQLPCTQSSEASFQSAGDCSAASRQDTGITVAGQKNKYVTKQKECLLKENAVQDTGDGMNSAKVQVTTSASPDFTVSDSAASSASCNTTSEPSQVTGLAKQESGRNIFEPVTRVPSAASSKSSLISSESCSSKKSIDLHSAASRKSSLPGSGMKLSALNTSCINTYIKLKRAGMLKEKPAKPAGQMKQDVCQCKICKQQFPSKEKLENHSYYCPGVHPP